MKASIVDSEHPDYILIRLEANHDDEFAGIAELRALDRNDESSPIGASGRGMVEVKVPRTFPHIV